MNFRVAAIVTLDSKRRLTVPASLAPASPGEHSMRSSTCKRTPSSLRTPQEPTWLPAALAKRQEQGRLRLRPVQTHHRIAVGRDDHGVFVREHARLVEDLVESQSKEHGFSRRGKWAAIIAAAALIAGCGKKDDAIAEAEKHDVANGISAPSIAETKAIAEEGLIYGLPIVMNYAVMSEYAVDRDSGQFKAPICCPSSSPLSAHVRRELARREPVSELRSGLETAEHLKESERRAAEF
jgi:hypothetical protein